MLDRRHPTNKHDVEIARIRRTTLIVYASLLAFASIATPVLTELLRPD